jgi:hypothetical protein
MALSRVETFLRGKHCIMIRMKIKYLLPMLLVSICSIHTSARDFVLRHGKTVCIACPEKEEAPVNAAMELLTRDCQRVFGATTSLNTAPRKSDIVVTTLSNELVRNCGEDFSDIDAHNEGFILKVRANGQLWIVGNDLHGAAYGVMQLSRLIGVSPWEWWADASPLPRKEFRLREGYADVESPSVPYRGIFINDEDWGLCPWSWKNHEPSATKGEIGPKTHQRIFELLLRLRANTFWPAMHECSVPFFCTEGNREMAQRYGIYIGTSHCEPMLRNTNGEWRRDGVGEYDFVHNRENVLNFWETRVKEVGENGGIFTLGMRGIHDGAMNGAKTIAEQKSALTEVIAAQRAMIQKYASKDVTHMPQVFIPYKEVLEVYHAGLEVPEDVTLMWCDDNYGYIRHFPTPAERARSGGNGIYYHTSYWGRPHDYLWISGTAPALLFHEMSKAYDAGIQRMWILNVGDIKPLEYQTELFLDMAWDIERVRREGVSMHQQHFLEREFGAEAARRLLPLMREHQRLSFVRKPEFLGGTRTEERDPAYKVIRDLPWSEGYIRERLGRYKSLSDSVDVIRQVLPFVKQESYFQLVEYPIKAAAEMNRKLLTAQLARHGDAEWSESDAAYDSIVSLTHRYNTPKWQGIMDFQPRKLPVFNRLEHCVGDTLEYVREVAPVFEYKLPEDSLVTLAPGDTRVFEMMVPSEGDLKKDSLRIELALLPNHPMEGEHLRIAVRLDDCEPVVVSYETQGRSEEWKENVLRNQALRTVLFSIGQQVTLHRLQVTAMDKGVVLQRISAYIQ